MSGPEQAATGRATGVFPTSCLCFVKVSDVCLGVGRSAVSRLSCSLSLQLNCLTSDVFTNIPLVVQEVLMGGREGERENIVLFNFLFFMYFPQLLSVYSLWSCHLKEQTP